MNLKVTLITSSIGIFFVLLNSLTLMGIDFFNAVAPMIMLVVSNFFIEGANQIRLKLIHKSVDEAHILYREHLQIKDMQVLNLLETLELKDKKIDNLLKQLTIKS